MKQSIINFPNQFKYQPQIENPKSWHSKPNFVLLGMGGSHLAGDLLLSLKTEIPITIHQDYGLPERINPKSHSVIACSYSGNTEEIIDGLKQALDQKYNCLIITTGGKLLEMALENNLPYIKIPDDGIQPRMAIGYLLQGLITAIGEPSLPTTLRHLSESLNPNQAKEQAEKILPLLKNKIPIIYGSNKNKALLYCWKIKFNETGKIPAFYNTLPELNHNEMAGFDFNEQSKPLNELFSFIIIKDETDNDKIKHRIDILKQILEDKNFPVTIINLEGRNPEEKIFQSLLVADWLTLNLANDYQAEPEQVPLIEKFKQLLN